MFRNVKDSISCTHGLGPRALAACLGYPRMRAAQLAVLHCEANSLKEWWKAPPPKGAGRAISDLLDLLADVNGDALRAAVMEGTPLQGDSRIYHSTKWLVSD